MEELKSGNEEFKKRFDEEFSKHVDGQDPKTVLVYCSDSRVKGEHAFGLGDKIGVAFVIRNAGNLVSGTESMGSIEYAVGHLKPERLIVLGHTKCGAIKARLGGGELPEKNLDALLKSMDYQGHLEERKGLMDRDGEWALHVYANIDRQLEALMSNPVIQNKIGNGLEVYGMVYDLETGGISVINKNGEKREPKSW